MGLLDKAKDMKKEEGAPAPEPEEKKEAVPEAAAKEEGPPTAKKLVKKKKLSKPVAKKKPAMKKPIPKKKKPVAKKKPVTKKPKRVRPKREKVVKEPLEPAIEGLPENLEFATFGNRLIAQLIDFLVLTVVIWTIGLIFIVIMDTVGFFIAIVLQLILPIAYFMLMEGNGGQTIGKRVMHVKVIRLDGRPLSSPKYVKSALWKGFLYPILNIIDGLVGIFGVHKDTLQRLSQYNDDLIVIAVEKKKVKFGYQSEEEVEEDAEAEEAGGEEAGEDAAVEEESVEEAAGEETESAEGETP